MKICFNKLFPFLILLLLILIVPTTFAQDIDNSTDVVLENTIDNGVNFDLEINNGADNGEILSDASDAIYVSTDGNDKNSGNESAPFATIYRAVNVALDSGITDIYILEGTYKENSIPIETSVNIRGLGNVIIDAEQTDRIFKIDGEYEVELSNLTLMNGVAPNDGVTYDIHETTYYAGGGAISIITAYVKMNYITFIDNFANEFGGAINVEAINCEIKNSRFISNYAGVFGGAIDFEDNNCTIENCTFIINEAGNGGAVGCIASACTIINSYFENNTAENGAAIFIENGELTGDDSNSHLIQNNKFIKNYATQQGGAIEVENQQMSQNADWTLIDSNEFIDNYAYNGGSISAYYGDAGIRNNLFINNTAGYGAAIASISTTDSAYIIIGGIYLKNNTIINCSAEENGNAIYNMGYFGSVANITFNGGETIYSPNGKAVILNVTVSDDMGNPISGSPIEFTVDGKDTINLPTDLYEGVGTVRYVPRENGTFVVSGKFYKKFNQNLINVISGNITANNAIADYFGTIYVSEGEGDDDNTGEEGSPVKTFNQAYVLATRTGGSFDIVVGEGTYYVPGYTVEKPFNVTGVGNAILDGKNQATLFALYGGPYDEFHFTGLTFTNGIADPSKYAGMNEGGAIFFKGGTLYLENDTFSANYANDYGGAVHINKGMSPYGEFYTAFAYINNCNFVNNAVKYFGGAISLYDSDVYVTNSNFESNKADKKGGAISILNGMANLTVINSTFYKNTAGDTGGAIDSEALNTYNIKYVVEIVNSTFTENNANYGGAISGTDSTVLNCIFTDNAANNYGGAVFFNDTISILENSIFEDNLAGEGSAYYGYTNLVFNNFLQENFATSSEIEKQNIAIIKNDTESRSFINPIVVNDTSIKSWVNIEITGPERVLEGNYIYEVKYLLNDGSDLKTSIPTLNVNVENKNSQNTIDISNLNVSNNPVLLNATIKASDKISILRNGKTITSISIDVHAKKNTTIELEEKTFIVSDLKSIRAVLKDSEGKVLANKPIVINNQTLTTDENGCVSLELNLTEVGEYNVYAYFSGDEDYIANYETSSVNVVKQNTTLTAQNKTFVVTATNKQFSVILKDINDNPLANKTIIIYVNGKTYKRTTNDNGQAILKVSFAVKTYVANVDFEGDDLYASSNAVATIKINKAKTTITAPKKNFKKSAITKKVTVTLKSSGKAVSKKKVTIKVNGKTYKKTTNSKGQVTVNVKLTAKKTYTYTVKFAGDSKYKAVSKKSTIKIK
ncbi:hypothetical protein [Methanobrevibacter sp.]|uniref:hypothetical protein n=1 Tax=Methanobrevibacter sp. TaxID=66852 RepID=UPI00386A0FB5